MLGTLHKKAAQGFFASKRPNGQIDAFYEKYVQTSWKNPVKMDVFRAFWGENVH